MIVVAMMFATPFAEICAQNNSNPWPVVGNVGIGAASNPGRLLNIHGVGSIGNVSDPTLRLSWHSSADDAFAPEFMAHLSLITSSYNRTMYSYCRDFFGSYQTTVKDLVLQTDIKAGDIIVANRCTTGYIRFATTPPPANPLSLQPGDLQDIERFTILPSGQVGVGTHSPYGKFDINFDSWNCEYPKISFSNNAPPGTTGYTANPSIRFYAATGTYQFGDPPVPLTCEQIPARAWWLEAWNGYPGSFHIRSGVSQLSSTVYESPAGLEVPISRMSFLGNGNVGVNNESPTARFQVTDGSVLFDGTVGATPTSGAGTRLMWIPERAAFRAGKLNDDTISLPDASGYWDNSNIGLYSVAIGLNTYARGGASGAFGHYSYINGDGYDQGAGHCSFAFGHEDTVSGNDAFVTGWRNHVRGLSSAAFGHQSEVFNSMSYSIGEYVRTGDTTRTRFFDKYHSVGIGAFLNATKPGAMIIGTGIGVTSIDPFSKRLTNSISNSLMVGFNSDTPTLFISGGDGSSGSFGNVGIGTTNPLSTLGVNGSIAVGWSGSQTPGDANTNLIVEKKVGIGTASPACSLGVDGTVCFGWGGSNAVPAVGGTGNPIGVIIEQSVVIGGTGTPLAPSYINGARSGQTSLLQVWGDAVKLGNSGTATWDIPSDARYKKDIHPYRDGLDLLKRINPVRFRYNERLGFNDDKESIGVIAQDMQEIFPYTVRADTLLHVVRTKMERRYQIDTVEKTVRQIADTTVKDEHGHYIYRDTVTFRPIKKWVIEPAEFATESSPILIYNPSALTYTIINSIKELDSTRIAETFALQEKVALLATKVATLAATDSLQQIEISTLQEKYDTHTAKHEALSSSNDSLRVILKNHEERLARLEAQNQIAVSDAADIILEQNNPNPFAESTTITYYIPDSVQGDAELLIAPTTQSPVLQHYILTKGIPTQITISSANLYTGVFVYSISINSKVFASKKFIVIK